MTKAQKDGETVAELRAVVEILQEEKYQLITSLAKTCKMK